jgi:molybdate transport system permease protein
MRHLFVTLAAVATAVALPLVAIFIKVPPGEIYGSQVARDALIVTLKTGLVANAVTLLVGTPAAYLLATRRFRGRAAIVTLFELPLVLPPAVAGIGLLVAFGRFGILGDELTALGISVPFTQLAVVLAVIFVAGPFYLRGAVSAFESVDPTLLEAARTLGASPGRVFRRVALPLAAGGLGASWALSFARGVGEFGATIIVAGSLQGRTQTLPLAIYAELDDLDIALAIGGQLVIFSFALLLAAKVLPSWRRVSFTSPWTSRGATSGSTSSLR